MCRVSISLGLDWIHARDAKRPSVAYVHRSLGGGGGGGWFVREPSGEQRSPSEFNLRRWLVCWFAGGNGVYRGSILFSLFSFFLPLLAFSVALHSIGTRRQFLAQSIS
eukprot:scaffold333566_cov33-Attheya_sp.AAC.1